MSIAREEKHLPILIAVCFVINFILGAIGQAMPEGSFAQIFSWQWGSLMFMAGCCLYGAKLHTDRWHISSAGFILISIGQGIFYTLQNNSSGEDAIPVFAAGMMVFIMAANMCAVNSSHTIAITSPVKELVSKDYFQNSSAKFFTLSPQDESLLSMLFNTLEENWSASDFDIAGFGRAMAMSTSQLYRTSVKLTSYSPNELLKEFRLEKTKEMMKKKRYSISQITFDSGFTSPSYFTKCFKKKYGLLPMAYLDLLH